MLFVLLILGGVLIGFVGFIWGLILAFRASIWWGLAFLFLPFGWVIFVLGHLRETGKAALLIVLGTGLVAVGAVLSPHKAQATATVPQAKTELAGKGFTLEPPRENHLVERQAQLKEYQAQADRRCAELTQKRAATNPQDKAAVAAFNAEVIQYNALLEQIKTLRGQLQNP